MCGYTVSESIAAPVIADATKPGTVTALESSEPDVLVQVSATCSQGSTVGLDPTGCGVIDQQWKATDGGEGLVAVGLRATRSRCTLVVTHPDGSSTVVTLPYSPDSTS